MMISNGVEHDEFIGNSESSLIQKRVGVIMAEDIERAIMFDRTEFQFEYGTVQGQPNDS